MRCTRHREMRAFFSCMVWRAIPSPLSKLHRRLVSLWATQWAPRDTRRDSRGERSPLLPLEVRPDSPGESGMQPRDPCRPWREKLGPGHKPFSQLEKNHVVPPSLQDEALARSSVSRVVSRSVFKCEMIFGTLNATPKVPRHTGRTRGEHRGSLPWHHFI